MRAAPPNHLGLVRGNEQPPMTGTGTMTDDEARPPAGFTEATGRQAGGHDGVWVKVDRGLAVAWIAPGYQRAVKVAAWMDEDTATAAAVGYLMGWLDHDRSVVPRRATGDTSSTRYLASRLGATLKPTGTDGE